MEQTPKDLTGSSETDKVGAFRVAQWLRLYAFNCRMYSFDPWSGTKVPHAVWEGPKTFRKLSGVEEFLGSPAVETPSSPAESPGSVLVQGTKIP